MHPAASVGFARGADAYERGRPSYPAAAVAWLVDELGLAPGTVAVDLAAGTGKLTRQLAASGTRVVAVEPVAGMRAMLARGAPGNVDVVAGIAEAVPLADRSADAVTVAQAFHWFDLDHALPEVHRVLRRRGRLAILYNSRDLDQPLFRRVDDLLERYRGDAPKHEFHPNLARLDDSPLFSLAAEREFPNSQRLDLGGYLDRMTSTSYVAALDADDRRQVEDELRALVAGVPEPIELRYRTTVHLYDRA
jgi:SAM-dependent methyltransferase